MKSLNRTFSSNRRFAPIRKAHLGCDKSTWISSVSSDRLSGASDSSEESVTSLVLPYNCYWTAISLLLPLRVLVEGHPCVLCRPFGFLPSDGGDAPSHSLVSLYSCNSRWSSIPQKLVVDGWDGLHHIDPRSTEDHVVQGLNVNHEKLCDDNVRIIADQQRDRARRSSLFPIKYIG